MALPRPCNATSPSGTYSWKTRLNISPAEENILRPDFYPATLPVPASSRADATPSLPFPSPSAAMAAPTTAACMTAADISHSPAGTIPPCCVWSSVSARQSHSLEGAHLFHPFRPCPPSSLRPGYALRRKLPRSIPRLPDRLEKDFRNYAKAKGIPLSGKTTEETPIFPSRTYRPRCRTSWAPLRPSSPAHAGRARRSPCHSLPRPWRHLLLYCRKKVKPHKEL